MKKLVQGTLFVLILSVTYSEPVMAQMDMEPHVGSAEFEQLKSLIGTWEGEMPMKKDGEEGGDPMKMVVEYRLTAGGSTIQEVINGGTPMEMVTMYHDNDGQLGFTHYCVLGNQPKMKLISSTENTMKFERADNDPEMHMHALELSFMDDDHIVQRWTMFKDGQPVPAHDTPLTRIQ